MVVMMMIKECGDGDEGGIMSLNFPLSLRPTGEEQSSTSESTGKKLPHLLRDVGWDYKRGKR